MATYKVMRVGTSTEIPGEWEYYLEIVEGRETGKQLTIRTFAPIDIKPLQRFEIDIPES